MTDAATTRSAKPQVVCYCDTDLVHSSYAVTGLIELADAGEIALRFQLRDRRLNVRRYPWTLWLNVIVAGDSYGICIDTHDVATYVCPYSLAACRYYYKTNLHAGTFEQAPPHLRERLRPFGPYLPCRPRRDRELLLRTLGNLVAKFRLRFLHPERQRTLRQRFAKFSWELRRHRRYLSRKVWTDYETPPREPAQAPSAATKIVFNPTCWDEAEGDAIRQMNEFRAELIGELRARLGDRFLGGFRRTGPSYPRYPAALETETLSHDEYLRTVHDAPIAVYTNGKWGCFSWRLPEAAAAAQCIVGEVPANDPGFPLDESTGYIACRTPSEMAATLERLLDSPDDVRQLRQRTWTNYVERLRPAARMRRLIQEAVSPSPHTAAIETAAAG